MKEETLAERIIRLREARHWRQSELARAANLSRQTVGNIETGRALLPGIGTLEAIAQALGVPVWELVGQRRVDVTAQGTGTASLDIQVIRAPTAEQIAAEVVKQLRADEPPDPERDPRLRHPVTVLRFEQRISAAEAWPIAEEYPTEHSRAHYWEVAVRGDCMAPRIDNGDLVWVDPSLPAQPGAVVVVYWENDWTLKRLRRRNGVWLLVPDNPAYEPLEVPSDQLRVLGVVVNVIKGRP